MEPNEKYNVAVSFAHWLAHDLMTMDERHPDLDISGFLEELTDRMMQEPDYENNFKFTPIKVLYHQWGNLQIKKTFEEMLTESGVILEGDGFE